MKMLMKIAVSAAATAATTLGAGAQGRFETYPLDGGTLHVYYSNDVMADASYIVETDEGLVTIETPLFKDNCKEFLNYAAKLGKPVVAEISDYHEGGTADHEVIQPEGMHKFMHEGVYDAMMKGFQKSFGESMVERPAGKAREVAFGDKVKLAGMDFKFEHGASNDFPAAAISFGGAYLTHWAPAKAHMNSLQLGGREAVAQALAGLEAAKKARAKYYLGSHGGAATLDDVKFRIGYLKTVGKLLAKNDSPEAFAQALKAAYPGLPGEEGVDILSKTLYK